MRDALLSVLEWIFRVAVIVGVVTAARLAFREYDHARVPMDVQVEVAADAKPG